MSGNMVQLYGCTNIFDWGEIMRRVGLIGGMSWESTDLYYQQINRAVQKRLGGLHSAKIILTSVDFAEIEELQRKGEWEEAGDYLAYEAQILEKADADCVVLCTNTMHKIADQIESAITIPFIHIADATADTIKAVGIDQVGLLGTAFTMEQDFYKARLEAQGINVLVPDCAERKVVHDVIFKELCCGIIQEDSKQKYIDIANDLIEKGAKGIILGCTEICMLIGDVEFSVPVFDTTSIHVDSVVEFILAE